MTEGITRTLKRLLSDTEPVPSGKVRVRTVNPEVGSMLGVDSAGALMLLFPRQGEGARVESFGRIQLVEETLREPNTDSFLAVRCRPEAPRSAVESLFEDLLVRSETWEPEVRRKGLRRALGEWQHLFSATAADWDRRRTAGLVAEMLHLRFLSEHVAGDPLAAWRGPTAAPHDFVIGDVAIEVKATTSTLATTVHVNDLDQMDPASVGHLYLSVVHLREDERGVSVLSIREELVNGGVVNRAALDARLTELGFPLDSEWADLRFGVRSVRTWEITDDSPGLRASRFLPQQLRGVSEISYVLSLHELGQPLDDEQRARHTAERLRG